MKITWYGTAAISIETEQDRIIFDPFVPISGSEVDIDHSDYDGFDKIFITHGHLDHIGSIPKLFKNSNANIWCTITPAVTLKKKGLPTNHIRVIGPDDEVALGEIRLQALQGKHIVYDKPYVKKTILSHRMLRHFYNIPWLLFQNTKCKENDETLAYAIEAEGKKILLLGSLGYDPRVTYPTKVDLLILPFQGASDLISPSLEIIEKIRPKRILVDHFDDTFPPISNNIPLDELEKTMRTHHPDIEVIIPKYKEPIFL